MNKVDYISIIIESKDYLAYLDGLEKRLEEGKIPKYWLDIGYSKRDTWTLYEKTEEGDEEVASGRFADVPGYDPEAEGDWNPFDEYFKKEYGIRPEEWKVN